MPRLFALIVFLCFALYSCKSDKASPAAVLGGAAGAMEVETFVVTAHPLENSITTHGSILPNEEIDLKSETSGQIIKINFKEGQKVKKGETLVQIDDSELRPNLERLKIQQKIAEDDLKRRQELFKIQGISREELETSELRVATLKADAQLVEAQLRNAKIVAPFNGTVGLRRVSEGAYVSAGDPIARLVQTDPVKIEFSVPETYAREIKPTTQIEFTLSGTSRKFIAEVYASEPSIDPSTRSMKVRALAENKDDVLVPGSFVELKITLGTIEKGMLIPALAVVQDIQGQKIYLIENGKTASKKVTTGIQKENLVQIREGVQPGDTVITTGLLGMREGAEVKAKSTKN